MTTRKEDPQEAAGDGAAWLDELADDGLIHFARELDAARPELSGAALDRIDQLVQSELRWVGLRRKMWRAAPPLVMVSASVLLAVGFFAGLFFAGGTSRDGGRAGGADVSRTEDRGNPTRARDQFVIRIHRAESADAPPEPLVPLERYESLIGEVE